MHLAIAILGLLCLLAGPALAYQRLVPPMTGFQIFAASGALGVLAVLWAWWSWCVGGASAPWSACCSAWCRSRP